MIAIKSQNIGGLVKKLEKVSKKLMEETLLKVIDEGTLDIQTHLKTKVVSGQVVKVRSGRYRASIARKIIKRKLHGIVGSKLVYARMLEHGTKGLPGGKLRPKRAKYLAIPLRAAQTRAARVSKKPRDFPNSFVIRAKHKGATQNLGKAYYYIVSKKGKKGKMKFLFKLVKWMRLEGKKPFTRTQLRMEEPIRQNAERRIDRMLKGAGL